MIRNEVYEKEKEKSQKKTETASSESGVIGILCVFKWESGGDVKRKKQHILTKTGLKKLERT